jgi:hypothetical protein
MEDAKSPARRRRLTDRKTNNSQNFYGKAIVRNNESEDKIKQYIRAIYFNKMSTNSQFLRKRYTYDIYYCPEMWCPSLSCSWPSQFHCTACCDSCCTEERDQETHCRRYNLPLRVQNLTRLASVVQHDINFKIYSRLFQFHLSLFQR